MANQSQAIRPGSLVPGHTGAPYGNPKPDLLNDKPKPVDPGVAKQYENAINKAIGNSKRPAEETQREAAIAAALKSLQEKGLIRIEPHRDGGNLIIIPEKKIPIVTNKEIPMVSGHVVGISAFEFPEEIKFKGAKVGVNGKVEGALAGTLVNDSVSTTELEDGTIVHKRDPYDWRIQDGTPLDRRVDPKVAAVTMNADVVAKELNRLSGTTLFSK